MKHILKSIYKITPHANIHLSLYMIVALCICGLVCGKVYSRKAYANINDTAIESKTHPQENTNLAPIALQNKQMLPATHSALPRIMKQQNIPTYTPQIHVAQESKYAKAHANCTLYKTADVTNNESYNIYFEIPETYFVEILYDQGNVYKVNYNQTIGYILPQSVTKVSFVPENPVLKNISFSLSEGTQLRSTPMLLESNIEYILPSNATLTYIAQTHGDASGGTNNDIWYYCHYSPVTDPTIVYTGYVYSARVQNLTPIPQNTETDTPVTQPTDTTNTNNQTVMPQKWILLLVSILPCVLVAILLFVHYKKRKMLANSMQNNVNFAKNSTQMQEIPLTTTRADIPAEYTIYPTHEHGKRQTHIKLTTEKQPKTHFLPEYENTPTLPDVTPNAHILQSRTFTAKQKHNWFQASPTQTLKDVATERKEKHRFIEKTSAEDF